MAISEARWDCTQCGTVGNRGRDRVCPNCGHSRPEKVRFYLPDETKKVEDEVLIQQAKIGPDWICDYCGASNHADKKNCKQCDALRDGSPTQEVKKYKLGEVPRQGDEADEPIPLPPEQEQTEEKPPAVASPTRWLIPLMLVFLCLCGTWFLFFRSTNVNATVTGFEWERTIQVEELKTLIEEDWKIPADGRYISEKEAIHHYDQVFVRNETRTRDIPEQVQTGTRSYVCGQKDLGNGFFEEITCQEPTYETRIRTETYQEPIYQDIPVYQTKYEYEIDRWVDGRLEKETGTTQNPEWPLIYLTEFEREGERNETYKVQFTDTDGERYPIEMKLQRWNSFSLGDEHVITVDSFGNAELEQE